MKPEDLVIGKCYTRFRHNELISHVEYAGIMDMDNGLHKFNVVNSRGWFSLDSYQIGREIREKEANVKAKATD